jgi:hypothetical protein
MRFSTRTKSKVVSASSGAEPSVAEARSKITKKPHNKLPARGEETSEEEEYLPNIPSPRIKIKRKFIKRSKALSVKASTGSKTSIASTKSKIVAKPHKKSPAGGEEAGEQITLHECDVLLGRGNGIASWVGNKNFRSIVFSYKKAYKKSPRHEKSLVSRQVIEDVHKGGGRFVERDSSGGHVEVTYEKALEKTCQCLREKPIGESENPIAGPANVLPKKSSEVIPAAKEEIPELSTSSAPAAKRKSMNSPSRPAKKAKKARTEEATKKATKVTKILPSVTTSMMTLKNNGPKKEPRVPQITLKNKPTKKEPQVPRKVIKVVQKSTSSTFAASATKVSPTYTSSGITTPVKRTESEDECRVQKLVDQAVKIKMMINPGDIDEMFVLAPPNLCSFFSGIVSLSERSIHAVTGKGHPGSDLFITPALTPTPGKSLAVLKQARDKHARDTGNPESPTNVTDFDRVMLEAIFEPAFESTQSSDFAMDLFEDSSAFLWPSHGYMG